MIEPHNPLKLIIPGAPTVSLKNERLIVVRGKKPFLVPTARVKKFMNNTRAAIRRQLASDWQVLERGVAVVLEMHLHYGTAFPRNDIDNFYTTVQECLQETLIENDKQIEYFLAYRKKSKSKTGQHSILYLWETTEFKIEELETFFTYKRSNIKHGTNEFGFINGSTGTQRTSYQSFDDFKTSMPVEHG